MRRKILQDFANVFCQMYVGWRMQEDQSQLIELGEAQITINVLNGSALLEANTPIQLWVAKEISAWFLGRLKEVNIPSSGILSAKLTVAQNLRLEETRTKKIAHFEFDCRSEIVTDEKVYRGVLKDSHSWHGNKRRR